MYLSSLSLQFFRNYESLQITFGKEINCIFGQNGEGKTNILDALHFLALTRGFRTSTDKQAVKEGESFFFIEGKFQEDLEKLTAIQCNLLPGKGKKVIVNGEVYSKLSAHIGRIPLITVLPSDTELVNGGGTIRREFIDAFISQYNPHYLQHLIYYKKYLEQRNALLKNFAEQKSFDAALLALWTEPIIPHGQAIWEERRAFLTAFQPLFSNFFHAIVSGKEQPEIVYESQIKTNTLAEWKACFQNSESKDRALQSTSVGTHKDDLSFQINGISAKNYGSQGQQKTFVIALKFAQYQLLSQQKGIAPLLLLDDIFDKLDEKRLQTIAHILDKELQGQIFITDTSIDRFQHIFEKAEKEVKFWEVCSNQVRNYV